MGSEGINKLARVIQGRAKSLNVQHLLDFGAIQDDFSLLTNKYPVPIPAKDYLICRSVSYDTTKPLSMTWWAEEAKTPVGGWDNEDWSDDGWMKGTKENHKPPDVIPAHAHGSKGEHKHDEDTDGKHYHDLYLPKKMHGLRPGDRVLVVWVDDDAVVIDIIVNADRRY